ncbi:MAG: hypothetical protein LQ340_000381 [Diploschistes diacapsis]|nr:MAG: hypothetical protein LQ340_000381 [Diploschistes diacapsis]
MVNEHRRLRELPDTLRSEADQSDSIESIRQEMSNLKMVPEGLARLDASLTKWKDAVEAGSSSVVKQLVDAVEKELRKSRSDVAEIKQSLSKARATLMTIMAVQLPAEAKLFDPEPQWKGKRQVRN